MVKRAFDIFLSLTLFGVFIIPMVITAWIIRWTSKGPAIHWSKRVGMNNDIFLMPKFRTMVTETPQLATHILAANSKSYLTPIGGFLRKTSIDELPQLWSVLIGDMSFVGPRPALFNQDDLIRLRTQKNIHTIKPGITGWAQINGRDDLPIPVKVQFDEEYLQKNGKLLFDLKIIFLTGIKVLRIEGVQH